MSRPLLLLDIDGVLQPVGSSVPPGYERIVTDDATVVLNVAHGRWLAELADDVEMVWVSTWGERANRLIGARLGLPELIHIELPDLPRDGTRKLQAVRSFVDRRPLAWVDDELYEDALAWAEERAAPTLLRRTRASIGLTREDVDVVAAFVRGL